MCYLLFGREPLIWSLFQLLKCAFIHMLKCTPSSKNYIRFKLYNIFSICNLIKFNLEKFSKFWIQKIMCQPIDSRALVNRINKFIHCWSLDPQAWRNTHAEMIILSVLLYFYGSQTLYSPTLPSCPYWSLQIWSRYYHAIR